MSNVFISSYEKQISFTPKIEKSAKEPWIIFGSDKQTFKKWVPEICGICCLKMVGDSYRATEEKTLYSLTTECESLGGFKHDNGQIRGVFHYPLLHLAQQYRLSGFVAKKFTVDDIINQIAQKRFVILSIDLQKINKKQSGSHLILVHGYDPSKKCFTIHDYAHAIAENGENAKLSKETIENISNNKGIILWK